MAPVRSYTNWNSRTTDEEEQIEPYRKYFFICEGANTETWYFKKLIDIRKELNIHPLIDIRLLEKTEGDRDISFPRRLIKFAENQKEKQQKNEKRTMPEFPAGLINRGICVILPMILRQPPAADKRTDEQDNISEQSDTGSDRDHRSDSAALHMAAPHF